MATKPSFRSNAVSKVDLSSTLQRGAVQRVEEPSAPPVAVVRQPAIVEERPAPSATVVRQSVNVEERPAFPPRRQVDSRKKKLAHLKTLLEYEEKKEITNLLHDIGEVVGHGIQFSIFNRGLLLAALAQRDDFLRVAKKIQAIERPSNGDVEAFREYEAHIGQMIFDAFDIRGTAPIRNK
jgi:hypothetical protein